MDALETVVSSGRSNVTGVLVPCVEHLHELLCEVCDGCLGYLAPELGADFDVGEILQEV